MSPESNQPAGSPAPHSPAAGTPVVAAAPVPPAAPLVSIDQFSQIELRIAKVLEAREHPNANKLLLLKVQVGEITKQIVAGIRAHYSPDSLVGRSIVIVNNLQPTMLRGEESQGMLLAASDGQKVVLLQPEQEIASGSRVK